MGYNDNHVNFETKPNPDTVVYTRTNGTPKTATDNLFVNENDQAGGDMSGILLGSNAYLRAYAAVDPTNGPAYNQRWRD
jgi:hypothetical protein